MAIPFSRLQLSFICCLLFIITFTPQSSADNNTQNFHYFCDSQSHNDRGNYTTNSTYQTNLNTLLSTLTSNTNINYGFYNFSYGESTNKVNAIGLCRGDVKPVECRNCLSQSKANLTQVCPNRKEAIGWYEDEKCMLRYSDRSIFNTVEVGPAYFAWSMQNATSPKEFNEAVETLLDSLKGKTASGDSRRKYATETGPGPDEITIYRLAQCTPDLSRPQCDTCLNLSITEVSRSCSNRLGCRIVRPSCNLRFEISPFYELPIADSTSQSPSPLSSSSPSPSVTNNTSSEGKSNASRTAATLVPLLLLLLCSFLSVSINYQ